MSEQIESTTELKQAVTKLIDHLAAARRAVRHPGAVGRAIFYDDLGQPIVGEPADLFLAAISRWDVAEDAVHGEVLRYPGVIELDSEAIESIRQFNNSKLRLKEIASSMPAANARDRQRKIRAAFKAIDIGAAHPLQCWREIPVFADAELRTIGFSIISSSISTEVLTRTELVNRLSQRDAGDVLEQASKFDFKVARWVLPVAPFIRANVSRIEEGVTRTQSIHASLPIVVQIGGWPKKVKYNLPSGTKKERSKDITAPLATIPLPFRDHAYLALS